MFTCKQCNQQNQLEAGVKVVDEIMCIRCYTRLIGLPGGSDFAYAISVDKMEKEGD